MSAERISKLLGKVLGDIKKKQGLSPELLSGICSLKEREAINTIKLVKTNLFIYVKSNSVLYGLNLKKSKILKTIKENTGEYVKDVIFKIGEFNGS